MKIASNTYKTSLLMVFGFLLLLNWQCKHDPDSTGTPSPGPPDPGPEACDTSSVTYQGNVLPIFQENCLGCHSGPDPQFGIDLTNFDHIAMLIESGSLAGAINHRQGFFSMPKNSPKLSECDIRSIEIWINDTLLTTSGCDTLNVTYPGTVFPILKSKCMNCHSGPDPQGNLDFNNYDQVAFLASSGTLMGALKHENGYVPMPRNGNKLDDCLIEKIGIWVRDTTFLDPGGNDDHPCDPDTVYFRNEIMPLINSSCATSGCHDQLTDEQDVLLVDYASVIEYGKIAPGDPFDSKLYKKIIEDDPDKRMPPPPRNPLSGEQKGLIKKWIEQGALNNQCDEACDTTNVTFSGSVFPIIQLNCIGCHSGNNPSGGILLSDYGSVVEQVNSGKLWGAVNHFPGFTPMPRNAPKLSQCNLDKIRIWIQNGANND